jgi:ABC-type sugar transport system substrate-binding protein
MMLPTRQRRSRRISLVLVVVATAVAALAAGCGSSSKSSSSPSTINSSNAAASSGSASGGLKAAQAYEQQAATLPKSIDLPPVSKAIPTGKTVTYVHCGVEVCSTISAAIKNAADVLGWNTKIVPSNGTPPSVKAAWDNVVRVKPAAAFGSGFDHTLFAQEAQQLSTDKVPVMQWATLDTSGNGVAYARGSTEAATAGNMMASWVVSSTGGKANTLYVDLPTYTILKPVKDGFVKSYKQWCSNCDLGFLSVPLTAIGKDGPSRIVSYLRAHPKVNRVALSYDGIGVGLPAALKAAGLAGKVQFVGEAPTTTNLAYVASGQEGATVNQGYYEIWAMFVDAAARATTGQSLEPDHAFKIPYFLVTKDNVAQAGTKFKPIVPNLDQKLRAIWKKA